MARHSFHNATLIDESALDAWRNLAYVYYQIDSTDAAIATYQKVASADPEDEGTFFSLGSLYLGKGDLDGAIGALSQAVKINPANLNALTNLAIAQTQAEDYEGAEANYRKVIEQNPDDFKPRTSTWATSTGSKKNTPRLSGPMSRPYSSNPTTGTHSTTSPWSTWPQRTWTVRCRSWSSSPNKCQTMR